MALSFLSIAAIDGTDGRAFGLAIDGRSFAAP
jgi:hypothetical protein